MSSMLDRKMRPEWSLKRKTNILNIIIRILCFCARVCRLFCHCFIDCPQVRSFCF